MVAALGTLGCAEAYSITISSKEGIVLCQLPVSELTWGRKLDDFSGATVVVPLADPACCACLSEVNVWHHEIQIYRDGAYVWSGPIVQITGTRKAVTLEARDLMALLDKRFIHNTLCYAKACGTASADLSVIGAAIIDDALIVDGHNYVIDATPTGIVGEVQYTTGQKTSLNALQEVMQLGLDVTVLGRKFVLGASNGGAPFGRTAALQCDDFLTDVSFEQDGLSTITRVGLIGGNGVIGVAKAAGSDVFGDTPYYGLLEYLSLDRGELDTQALADQGAAAIIASAYPPPTNLITPANAQLNTNAPVTIADLVPGTLTTIIIDCLCRPVTQDMVLIEMSVTWDADGEKVGVTYGSLGSQNSGENNVGG